MLRDPSARTNILLTSKWQMLIYHDFAETPASTTSLPRLPTALPEGWRDYLVMSILYGADETGYGLKSYLENRFLNGQEGQWRDSLDYSTTVASTMMPLSVSFERTFIGNPILPAQLGARVTACALPAMIDSLAALEIHHSDHHWKPALDVPWWESQLPAIRAQLASYIRKRLPTRPVDHDDLINETFLSFCQQIRSHPGAFPESWFFTTEPESDRDQIYLQQFLTVILRRRIADLFRTETRKAITFCDDSLSDFANNQEAPSERQVLLAAMLAVVVRTLTDLSREERDILALVSGTGGFFEKTLGARDRQRLRRLRMKLASRIRNHFGSKVSDLLSDEV